MQEACYRLHMVSDVRATCLWGRLHKVAGFRTTCLKGRLHKVAGFRANCLSVQVQEVPKDALLQGECGGHQGCRTALRQDS